MRRLIVMVVGMCCVGPGASADIVDDVMTGALSGETLSVRIEALREGMDGEDQRAHLAMGVLLKARAGELAGQWVWRHGLHDGVSRALDLRTLIPWLGDAEIPEEPEPVVALATDPAPFSYDDFRAGVEERYELMRQADAHFARVDDPDVKLVSNQELLARDYNADGRLSPEEVETARSRVPADAELIRQEWRRLGAPADAIEQKLNPPQVVALDAADASMMRSNVQKSLAFHAGLLALDLREPFDHLAHLISPRPKTAHDDILKPPVADPDAAPLEGAIWQIADLFAAVHAAEVRVVDEAMREAVLDHALTSIRCNREGLDRVLAETDDDRERIPGPQQTGYISGLRMDDAYLAAVRAWLDHREDLLMGRVLVPFWRDGWEQRAMAGHGLGLNLRRAILEPESYDPILWLHGTAATPYLEEGPFLPMDVREQIREGLSAQRQWDPREFRPDDHPWPDRDP